MKNNDLNDVSNIAIYGTLIVVFCMVLLTLLEPLMGWVWVLCACTICIAVMRIKKRLPSVKNLTLNLLAIFCMALLIYLSSDFGLMSTMVNLLVVAACLKLINLQTRADYHLVLIVLFFLIACGFIYHQNIYIVAYYFACLVVLFVSAFLLNRGHLDINTSITQSGKMMLQALPITMALFIVVPRLPPFWQTTIEKSTQTGLSEQITPGDIANLAQSDELVFRAEFDSNIPSPQQRYWRSIVLDYFDGKTWRVSGSEKTIAIRPPNVEITDLPQEYFRYLMITEPNNTQWLYSLDIPNIEETISPQEIYQNRQYQLFQAQATEQASMYILKSFPSAKLDNFIPERDFSRYLQVPIDSNARTQEWVANNINREMNFSQKLQVLNGFFTQRNFEYTLKPPLMPSSPVDAFLFEHQSGFCSHYASALTYMLRLANIPSRMVAGYQGGLSQGENIISVHQFDAHAWVEAYDSEYGWVRLDPTALVAPNRTLNGLMSALSAQESLSLNDDIGSFFDLPFLADLQESFAVLDHNWNQMILGFNNESQSSMVEKIFGELSPKNLTTFLLISLSTIALFLALLFLPYKRWFVPTKNNAVHRVLLLLEKYEIKRNSNETLKHFYERIAEQLDPSFRHTFKEFVEHFYEMEYQQSKTISDASLRELFERLRKEKNVLIIQE